MPFGDDFDMTLHPFWQLHCGALLARLDRLRRLHFVLEITLTPLRKVVNE